MSYQSIQILGNLGADPQFTPVGDGGVSKFSIAVSEKWKDKGGQQQEHTEWFRCEAWGKLADIAEQYLSKGNQVFVTGTLKTQTYKDKDNGADRYSTTLRVRDLRLIGGRSDSSGQQERTHAGRPDQQAGGSPGGADFDESIPF